MYDEHMKRFVPYLLLFVSGCMTPKQKMDYYIKIVESKPAHERPPDWENTRRLIQRPAPKVGDNAPDFSLPTLDQEMSLTRSTYQAGKPLVLVFGSFT